MPDIDPELKPYESHAFFALRFLCAQCGCRMSEEGVVGVLHTEEWYLNLARKARSEGWKVVHEWEAICPSCSSRTTSQKVMT